MTRHPVYHVLHAPMTFLLVERRLLAYAVTLAMIVLLFTGWLSAAVVTFAAGYAVAYAMRDDPQLLTAIGRALRLRTHYDPAAYRPFRVEVH